MFPVKASARVLFVRGPLALPPAGRGELLVILFQREKPPKNTEKIWGSMGEAWGKRGGSVGEAGGSRGILRGSTLFDLGKTQCFGGKQLAPVPLLKF